MKNKLLFYLDLKDNNQAKIIAHILVWLMFCSFPLYMIFSAEKNNYGFLITLFFNITLFYINFSWLVPKFMIKKRWKPYILYLIILLFLHIIIFTLGIPKPPLEDFNQMPDELKKVLPENGMFNFFPGIMMFVLIISVSSFLKLYEFWNENYKKQKEIENENRSIELNFLKSQLNPHFFFNSLNTIYSLSISKSDKTSDAILNLSELMRYMLNEKKSIDSKVRLSEELEYIKNYIELQKLRLTPNNKILFIIEGEINNINLYPLLFISFIENAFKFGVHPIDTTEIKIFFKIENNNLFFEVTNHIHFQKSSYNSFGVGNQNSIKRLNLYYPSNLLKIVITETYNVNLKLELNEN